jgi:hypothetical protein
MCKGRDDLQHPRMIASLVRSVSKSLRGQMGGLYCRRHKVMFGYTELIESFSVTPRDSPKSNGPSPYHADLPDFLPAPHHSFRFESPKFLTSRRASQEVHHPSATAHWTGDTLCSDLNPLIKAKFEFLPATAISPRAHWIPFDLQS